jgi:hypothetical protein
MPKPKIDPTAAVLSALSAISKRMDEQDAAIKMLAEKAPPAAKPTAKSARKGQFTPSVVVDDGLRAESWVGKDGKVLVSIKAVKADGTVGKSAIHAVSEDSLKAWGSDKMIGVFRKVMKASGC